MYLYLVKGTCDEDSTLESGFSLHHVDPRHQTQVVRLEASAFPTKQPHGAIDPSI